MNDLFNIIKEEGDELSWIYKDFNCFIKRNHLKAWCGYVKIPKELPLNFDFKSDDYFPLICHGGITFQSSNDELFNVVGFDCAHSGDLIPKMLEFDSTHGDRNTYKDKDFVISETNSIVDQIIEFKEVKRHLKIKNLLKDI